METCYVDKEHNAIADLVRPGELTANWTITRINVPKAHRGRGYGSALLRRILADADAEQVILQLEISPSDGLTYSQLAAWYYRNGFKPQAHGYMRRKPKGTEYEVYVEVFYILEREPDYSIKRTESSGSRWVAQTVVDANLPDVTNVVYAAASDEFAHNNSTIRKRR
jgi:GNAT superfamily N-acetyltransferase